MIVLRLFLKCYSEYQNTSANTCWDKMILILKKMSGINSKLRGIGCNSSLAKGYENLRSEGYRNGGRSHIDTHQGRKSGTENRDGENNL